MANTISSYASIFQQELDKQITAGATSGWMEENCTQVIYNGGKEIKMPKMSLQGLGAYDRDTGYTSGAVTFGYETMTMTQDRGRRFRLDAMDVDETAFGMTAANVISEFQRTRVIPEIDAYRYSKLASLAENKLEYTPDAASVYSTLMGQLSEINDLTGGECELMVVMSRPVYDLLMQSGEIQKTIDAACFEQGELSVEVKSVNGAKLIPVPSARMKTEYTFLSGADGETDGGFAPTDTAVGINWIICPKNAPVAVSKTDNVKIISPEANQFADAWDIDYRKYHDLFLPENAAEAIAVCVEE